MKYDLVKHFIAKIYNPLEARKGFIHRNFGIN